MRVVIAPDSFKGTINAADAARALAVGWLLRRPDDEVRLLPLADGGEGTLDVFAAVSANSTRHTISVCGPDDRRVDADWLLLPDGTAIVELAQSSGLALMAVPDPLGAHTIGLGETIAEALEAGCDRLVIALGGSASTDGGTGALSALGARFVNAGGKEVERGGGQLTDLCRVDVDRLRPPPRNGVALLCDVTAPLLGPAGAAVTYGPQKGASGSDVWQLERGLQRLSEVLGGEPDAAGAGVAGGAAFGLATLWGATIVPGAATIAAMAGLRAAIDDSEIVITGEGRLDPTSFTGKVVGQVVSDAAGRARIALVAGSVAVDQPAGIDEVISLSDLAGSSAAAIDNPARWLAVAGERLAERFSRG